MVLFSKVKRKQFSTLKTTFKHALMTKTDSLQNNQKYSNDTFQLQITHLLYGYLAGKQPVFRLY